MYRGYIKLWRCISDNPITKKPEYISVWIYLLYSVNHSDSEIIFNDKKILIKSGSMITSRAKIAENTGVQESKVERILNYLKTEQQIEQQSFNKYRIISICNWPKYQQSEQQIEQPVNSNRTASEQQVNTNKNDKNVKNVKNKSISDFVLPKNIKKETWDAYLEMRKSIKKPATIHAKKLIIKKLLNMSGDPNLILEQSIEGSWQNVYELKTGGDNNGTAGFTANRKIYSERDARNAAACDEADAINRRHAERLAREHVQNTSNGNT